MTSPGTIAFLPEPGAWGPTNNCVAVAEVLAQRGHRIVFLVDESFRGLLEQRGYEERHFRLSAPPESGEERVGEVWVEYIRATAPEFRTPTIEQLTTVIRPIWEELVSGAAYAEERLQEIFAEVRPDVIVIDNVSAFPAVSTAGVPWVRMMSANPLEAGAPDLPPVFSGYSTRDRDGWDEFRREYASTHAELHAGFAELCREHGAGPLPELEFQYESPWLNMYLYAAEVDYPRATPLGRTWHRLDTTVRTSEEPFDVAAELPGEEPVVYLSLGSLGSLDTGLMQRLIDLLDAMPYRVIVSMGTLHEELRLGARMYGREFLPQPSILPQCDLVITHGGNNTFNEALHFALPSIQLPLFWDQYDNAQRAEDSGIGRRLATYTFKPAELGESIDVLLADDALHARLAAISARVQAEPGRVKAATLIERLLTSGEPVAR